MKMVVGRDALALLNQSGDEPPPQAANDRQAMGTAAMRSPDIVSRSTS